MDSRFEILNNVQERLNFCVFLLLKIRNLFIFRTDESCTFPIGDLVLVDDFHLLFELRSQTTDFNLYLSFEVAYFFLILSVDTLEVLD
jgi:hypothetical protein